eukprot:64454_1
MTTRARLQNANDSKSLWNYTLSPGWSEFDAHILRLAIMRYGCGSWRSIGTHFPLKNCNQLNLQTQRLFGQQALAEFNKVHIDPNHILEINDKIDGFRKNSCLINTGNNVSAQEKLRRRDAHIKTHGIPKELYEKIKVPVVLDPPVEGKTLIDHIEKLREMYRCVYDIDLRVQQLKNNPTKKTQKVQSKTKTDASNNSESTNTNIKPSNANAVDPDDDCKDVEMTEENERSIGGCVDADVALAMALSESMNAANINTPLPEKYKKAKKQGTKKRKAKNKRKKMEEEQDYSPHFPKKKVRTK